MTFTITQGDNSPSMIVRLGSGTERVDLSTVRKIRFFMQDKYERVVLTKESKSPDGLNKVPEEGDGKVEVIFTEEETENVGTYEGEFEVVFTDGSIETFPTGNKNITIEIEEQIQ